jgi:4-hydroxy-tetrahydrodipicolinate reductase
VAAPQALKVGVAGALGRMGRTVALIVEARGDMRLAAVFDRPDAPEAEGLMSAEAAMEASDVIIDFSTAAAAAALARRAAVRGAPALVIGPTGATKEEDRIIRAAAERIAIVRASNFSLGINVLFGLIEQAAKRLGPEDWDIEIFEAHHKFKQDAPSGTALSMGEAAAKARGVELSKVAAGQRDGRAGRRAAGAIGFAVSRGGGVIGEHAISFVGADETLTLSHTAQDRSLFARGAVVAAHWVASQPAGLYDMRDVLGF